MTEKLEQLTNKELLTQTLKSVKDEKNATYVLLLHLHEIQKRRLYAEIGYASLWEYTVKELQYSEAAASERCNAMRICFTLPEARSKIQTGELSLTSASKIQRFIYAEKKRTGKEMKVENKANLLKEITGKSTREIEKIFTAINPELPPKEKVRLVGHGEQTSLQFSIDQETLELLTRLKELRGNINLSEAFKLTLKHYIEKNDPLLKKSKTKAAAEMQKTPTHNSAKNVRPVQAPKVKSAMKSNSLHNSTAHRTYKNISVKALLWKKSGGRCEYKAKDGQRCVSKTRLQVDHIVPLGKNGGSEIENLRLLCPEHNRFAAVKEYGHKKMSAYIN